LSKVRDGSSAFGALGLAGVRSALVVALLTTAARASAQNVYLVADASTDAATPATRAGSAVSLHVSPSGVAFVRFDLSALPTNMVVEQATLIVRPLRVLTPGDVAVHVASAEWQEDTLTHENKPAWDAAAIAQQRVSEESAGGGDLTFGVRAAVSAWLAGAPNHGLVLVGDGLVDVDLASKENQSVSAPARLEVVLVPAPPAP
jgi:hypothetical protein